MNHQIVEIPEGESGNGRRIRLNALWDACEHVCSQCSGNGLPNEKETHLVHGPNDAGNYTHIYYSKNHLCEANGIWALVRWEFGKDRVGRRQTERRDKAAIAKRDRAETPKPRARRGKKTA